MGGEVIGWRLQGVGSWQAGCQVQVTGALIGGVTWASLAGFTKYKVDYTASCTAWFARSPARF
jgi:hypothetical protein